MNSLSKNNILIIDDSFVNRQFIKATLEELNIYVTEAGDGSEALDILGTFTPDLVVLDLLMPVMGGLETLEKIRAAGYKFPVLVLTADINESTRKKCNELGVLGFINKPTNANELLRIINSVLCT